MEKIIVPKDLIHKNENKYFVLVLIISIISYISLVLSLVGVIILAGFLLLSLFLHALMIGHIRTNAVLLNRIQFSSVYEKAEELCLKMGLSKVPDIYIMQSGGILNAFATRFFGKNMVVLYSEVFELILSNNEEELNFILAHELAHMKRNHLSKMMFILPAMWLPGIAELYLRACEYTCDRYAAYYTGDVIASKNSLMVLAVGKHLYPYVNEDEYLKQIRDERGFFIWLSEILSTHPPLPKRINEINMFFGVQTQTYKMPKMSVIAVTLMIAGILSCIVIIVGLVYTFGDETWSNPFREMEEEILDEDYGEGIPIFIASVANGNTEQVKGLLAKGEDIHQEDFNGNTALDWAVKAGDKKMANLLLDSGADPNYESSYGTTSLMTASEIGDLDMVKLLVKKGGNPNYQESNGMTALFYAVYSSDPKIVELLLELGANPKLKDDQNMTAYLYAIESNERKIAGLLKIRN